MVRKYESEISKPFCTVPHFMGRLWGRGEHWAAIRDA
ncbi:unnamed protein product, partial [Tuber aestivum]